MLFTVISCLLTITLPGQPQIIYDWEKSGNGFGQRALSEAGWGTFTSEHLELEDGDNRANFLRREYYNKEHLLYLWHLADTLGLLSNMLNVLAKDVAIDCDGQIEVSTSLVQKKRKKPAAASFEEERLDRKVHRRRTATALTFLALSDMKDTLMKTWQLAAEFEIKALDASSPLHFQVYKKQQASYEKEAKKIQDDLAKMNLSFYGITDMPGVTVGESLNETASV